MGSDANKALNPDFIEKVCEVVELFSDTMDPGILTPDFTLGQIPEWDSMNRINFNMGLEKAYGLEAGDLEFTDEDSLATVAEVIAEKTK